MNLLITSDEQLRRFVPNCLKTVEGELPLFSKIESYIRSAQLWLEKTFFSGSALLRDVNENSDIYVLCVRIVAYEAYRRALPALDIVLTPNGFATVGNQTLSPASRMRVDALAASLVDERDDAIVMLVHTLSTDSEWRGSKSGCWFAATLSPFPEVVRETGVANNIWTEYLALRSKMIEYESDLIEDWFGKELFKALRDETLGGSQTPARKYLADNLRYIVFARVRGTSISDGKLRVWVNYVRRHPDVFPEWHNSSVAELFRPPVFRNSQDSSGYFF